MKDNQILVKRKWYDKIRVSSAPIKIEPHCDFGNSKTLWTMGSFSYSHSQLPATATVGRYCSIAFGLCIMGVQHPTTRFTTSPITYDKNFLSIEDKIKTSPIVDSVKDLTITIKNDVWIGQNVTLKNGITINNGAIIAANSVVTKDVPPFAIVGGVPAKVIKYRFDASTIKAILSLSWWEYNCFDFSTIEMGGDIQQFIEQFSTLIMDSAIQKYTPNAVHI